MAEEGFSEGVALEAPLMAGRWPPGEVRWKWGPLCSEYGWRPTDSARGPTEWDTPERLQAAGVTGGHRCPNRRHGHCPGREQSTHRMGTGDRLGAGAFGALVSAEGEERVHSASSLDVGGALQVGGGVSPALTPSC